MSSVATLMRRLPKPNLWDTIQMSSGSEPPSTKNYFARVACSHPRKESYVRIDHRAGPGSFADNFEGVVCLTCGDIVHELQTL